jgi:hypothetical protein
MSCLYICLYVKFEILQTTCRLWVVHALPNGELLVARIHVVVRVFGGQSRVRALGEEQGRPALPLAATELRSSHLRGGRGALPQIPRATRSMVCFFIFEMQ